MNKPILIDGVDVSGCRHFDKDNNQKKVFDCYEIEGFPNFCKGYNCYYKQLQRMKAENERLKQPSLIVPMPKQTGVPIDMYLQLKQAIEEVREIVDKECKKCKNDEFGEDYCIGSEFCALAEINEVLKDE